jgi:hypothetical protein
MMRSSRSEGGNFLPNSEVSMSIGKPVEKSKALVPISDPTPSTTPLPFP